MPDPKCFGPEFLLGLGSPVLDIGCASTARWVFGTLIHCTVGLRHPHPLHCGSSAPSRRKPPYRTVLMVLSATDNPALQSSLRNTFIRQMKPSRPWNLHGHGTFMAMKPLWTWNLYGHETFMAMKPSWTWNPYGHETFMAMKPLWPWNLYDRAAFMATRAIQNKAHLSKEINAWNKAFFV